MLAFTLALTFAAPVGEIPSLPTTPPPVQCLVSLEKDGRIVLVNSLTEYKQIPLETRLPNGTTLKSTVLVPEVTYRTQKYAQKDVQVFDTRGKPIDANKLPELLKERIPALVSADGNKVDPLHLRIVKEGTLVFVVPGWQSRPVPEKLPPEK